MCAVSLTELTDPVPLSQISLFHPAPNDCPFLRRGKQISRGMGEAGREIVPDSGFSLGCVCFLLLFTVFVTLGLGAW